MNNPKTTAGVAVKIFLYSALAAVLCFFLHMSLTMALSAVGTQIIGKSVSGVLEDGRTIVCDTYNATEEKEAYTEVYILDGETKIPLAEEQLDDYPITQSFTVNIRSDVDPLMLSIKNAVAQGLMLILFLAFPYSTLWYVGDHDRNQVQFGHMAENRWRGVAVGALASIPAVVMWLVLLIGKVGGQFPGFAVWYRWFNWCFLPYVESVIPSTVSNPADVSWLGIAATIPVLLALPVVCGIGYLLGYKEFSVRDRLVYSATGKKPKRRKK